MTTLDATSVAALLREFGQRSALRGDNPFRAKAYARAADNLLTLTLPLDQIIAEERLREIPGVGEAIADIIKKLHATGAHPALEKMRKEIPVGVLEMLTVPGLRPDKVLKLYQELGLSSLAELEEAAREGRLQKIKGLGASLQTKILRGIEMQRAAQGRWHMHRAAELLKTAEKHLREARPDIVRISAAGDLRRGCELVGDLSIVAEVSKLPQWALHSQGGRGIDGPPDRHRALWHHASAGDRLGRASRVSTRRCSGAGHEPGR